MKNMHPDNAQKAFEHIDKLLNKQTLNYYTCVTTIQ